MKELGLHRQLVLFPFIPSHSASPSHLVASILEDCANRLGELVCRAAEINNLPRVPVHAPMNPDAIHVGELLVTIRVVQALRPSDAVSSPLEHPFFPTTRPSRVHLQQRLVHAMTRNFYACFAPEQSLGHGDPVLLKSTCEP